MELVTAAPHYIRIMGMCLIDSLSIKKSSMRTKNRCYECIRCGYKTEQKWCMKSHLYNRKSPCPGSCHNICMTAEIKEHILEFKSYKLTKQHTRSSAITNNINSYHTVVNALTSMDPMDKVGRYIAFKRLNMRSFGDVVADRLAMRVKQLDGKHAMTVVSGFGKLYILEAIDEATLIGTMKDIDCTGFVYDKQRSRIYIHDGENWADGLVQGGVERMVVVLQGVLFNKFESYCVKRLEDHTDPLGQRDRCACLSALQRYYGFLAGMGLSCQTHLIEGIQDDVVLKYKTMCSEERAKVAKTEMARTRRRVIDIIRRNSKHNMDLLDKQILKAVLGSQSAHAHFFGPSGPRNLLSA